MGVLPWVVSVRFSVARMGYCCGVSVGLSVAGMGVFLWAVSMGFVRCWYGGIAVEFLWICPLLVWGYCCGLSMTLSVTGMARACAVGCVYGVVPSERFHNLMAVCVWLLIAGMGVVL